MADMSEIANMSDQEYAYYSKTGMTWAEEDGVSRCQTVRIPGLNEIRAEWLHNNGYPDENVYEKQTGATRNPTYKDNPYNINPNHPKYAEVPSVWHLDHSTEDGTENDYVPDAYDLERYGNQYR